MKTKWRVLMGLSVWLAGAVVAAGEIGQKPVSLAIDRGTLADALAQWAQQTGFQLASSVESTTTLEAPKLEGSYTPQAALERLLAGTTLTYVWLNERTVAIREKGEEGKPVALADTQSSALQVAQADGNTAPEVTERQPASEGDRAKREGTHLEEIVVTGSRLIRTREDGPAPVTVFDRARIDQLGATSVSQVLDYLPQQPFSFGEGSSTSAAREVRLRGLSSGTTLVLINGRRTITSALTAGSGAFDTNSIPLAAVERIEILSESASAVYGADALAGVVNIILKDKIDRPSAEAYYGAATEGGANERRASLTAGHESDRWRLLGTLDVFENSGLLGRDRARTADADFTRFGGRDSRSTAANPGNVCSADFFSNLPGLSGPCAAVPIGSSGVGLTPADFAATVGQQNLTNPFAASTLLPESRRISGSGFLTWNMTDRTRLFAELLHADGEVTVRYGSPAGQFLFVTETQAFNPFDVPVFVDFQTEGLNGRETSDTQTSRAVLGLKGELQAGTWRTLDWEFNMLGLREEGTNVRTGVLDPVLLAAALSTADPAQALNVFQDGPGGSPELLASLLSTSKGADNLSRAWQASAFARMPLMILPAGPLAAVVGAETRNEELEFFIPGTPIAPDRKSSAAYAELSVPLANKDMGVSGIERLTLKLAGRYDHYDDFGDVFNPQYGLEWQPIAQLLLRTAYSTSFKAPALVQLHRPTLVLPFPLFFLDPARNGEPALAAVSFGGNPRLDPEEGRSFSIGAVLTPASSDRMRLSVNYWKLVQTQTVRGLDPTVVLANESLFPGLVVRDPPTAGDIANGVPGVLRAIDVSSINFGRIDLKGIDVEAWTRWNTRWGAFSPSVTATRIDRYEAAEVPGQAAVDRIGRASGDGTIPRYRATATLAWGMRGFNLSTTGRYTSSYRDFDILFGSLTDRQISATTFIDLQGSIDLDALLPSSQWLSGVRVRAGILNLFDKEAEFSEAGTQGFDASLADLRQRYGYLAISKDF